MNKMFSTLCKALIILTGFSIPISAWAGDIYTTIGKPGTVNWAINCPSFTGGSLPGNIDNLDACDPTTTNCLRRVTLNTTVHSNATCNDGSPGTFYIREGQNGDEDKWIVHLQGGASCMTGKECLQRWCGEQGIYTADKMSSNWDYSLFDPTVPPYAQPNDLPKYASAEGIFSDDSNNDFKDWTHVWVYYCSSDNWSGTVSDVSYTHGAQTFSIDHQGHNIIKAVSKKLRQTTALGSNEISDDYQNLPDIDTASHIILSGTSAGAYGAMQHADWFFSHMSSNIGQKHYLVMDGAMETTKEQASVYSLNIDDNGVLSTYGQWRRDAEFSSWSGGYYDSIDAFVDVSCKTQYPSHAQAHRCSAGGRLLASDINHISTPTFIRYDLEDQALSKPWIGVFPNLTVLLDGTITDLGSHSTVLNASLVELYDSTNSVTGVFAPKCGNHVGLERNDPFFGHVTPHHARHVMPPYLFPTYGPVANSESNFSQTLLDWLNLTGASPTPIIVVDSILGNMSSSVCDPAP